MTSFLSWNYWSLLDHDLMVSIWKKAISILARNLNSGGSYLITAVNNFSKVGRFEKSASLKVNLTICKIVCFSKKKVNQLLKKFSNIVKKLIPDILPAQHRLIIFRKSLLFNICIKQFERKFYMTLKFRYSEKVTQKIFPSSTYNLTLLLM